MRWANPFGAAMALGLLLASATAVADPVPPRPKQCPPGTWPQTTHLGPHCAPSVCRTDADCKKGESCREHALCVLDRSTDTSRGRIHHVEAKGSCNEGQACPSGTECKKALRCMPPPGKGCAGCRVGPGSAPHVPLGLGLLGLAWLTRLWRRPPRQRRG